MATKVRRVLDKYDLENFGDELAARWTGDGYERESLRALSDRFNQQVLAARLRNAGQSPLDGEVENTYRLLTDDDVSAGMQTQAQRRLERDGIDVDELRRDFASHQAIHTYLTKDRDVTPPNQQLSAAERLERDRETIQRLESRLEAVADNTLDRLRSTDQLSLGQFSVLVDVRVLCEDCGEQYDVSELLDAGQCACYESGEFDRSR
ncbi:rod-determining factor RdfA [Haloferacaceae archaeon DSL9]